MTGLRLNPVVPAPNVPAIELQVGQSKTVGRGRQADVMVDDASLSRLHARIALDQDGQLSVDDLGSTNGVFVNGTEQLSAYLMLGDCSVACLVEANHCFSLRTWSLTFHLLSHLPLNLPLVIPM